VKYRVSVDLSGVAVAVSGLLQDAMPLVRQAVWAVGNEAAARWKHAVMHAHIWQGEKEPYVNSIEVVEDGPFSVRVTTSYKHAEAIESGRPAVDQKKYLSTSLKARQVVSGKHKGQKYLIIPFRHNTPGMDAHAAPMPAAVYQHALALTPSRQTGSRMVPNVHGRVDAHGTVIPVKRATYKWGTSLPAGLVGKSAPHHATDRYAGMVRMDTTPGGAGHGKGPRSSAYLTFRVMGQWSNGWILPAKPGLYLARDVAEQIQPLAESAIRQAFDLTVKDLLPKS
jgi:hypothetical protein